jgi:hypothetical protein
LAPRSLLHSKRRLMGLDNRGRKPKGGAFSVKLTKGLNTSALTRTLLPTELGR